MPVLAVVVVVVVPVVFASCSIPHTAPNRALMWLCASAALFTARDAARVLVVQHCDWDSAVAHENIHYRSRMLTNPVLTNS